MSRRTVDLKCSFCVTPFTDMVQRDVLCPRWMSAIQHASGYDNAQLKLTTLLREHRDDVRVEDDPHVRHAKTQVKKAIMWMKRLQNIMGYLLLQQPFLEVITVLEGPPKSGKSLIKSVMASLVGHEQVARLSFVMFDGRFALSSVADKRLLCVHVARRPCTDVQAALGLLLAVAAHERVVVERRYVGRQAMRLQAHVVMECQELPLDLQKSSAFMNRACIFKCHAVEDDADAHLPEILRAEVGGIFLWALDGMLRVATSRSIDAECVLGPSAWTGEGGDA